MITGNQFLEGAVSITEAGMKIGLGYLEMIGY
ncbi:MAG: lipocalin family protein [Gammaproteobacteria bacterium]|nr:lipocalin family protein [Gammaproteobacteria bacterium]